MAMARGSSGLAYPDRFFAAASYAGFDGSTITTTSSKFANDAALLLYALYQQATAGPCDAPKPRGWSPVEQSKWTSWHGLGKMPSTEAMRLFVKILEEEDPEWYSQASSSIAQPVIDLEVNHDAKVEPSIENGTPFPEIKSVISENGSILDTQDKDVKVDDVGFIGVYDQWIAPPICGQLPKSRYEHGAAVVREKMYIFGGNHNGRYLNDLQVLDLRTWTWSKVEIKAGNEQDASSPLNMTPCAGHSLIPWEDKLLSIAGHTKDPSESLQVKIFDLQTLTWSNLKTYGKSPASRGGQSVCRAGTSLVIFGGQDAKRSLLNDLHFLDLETMTWDEMEVM